LLIQKIISRNRIEKVILHRANVTTLKGSEVPNAMLMNLSMKRSDAFFRFVLVGRADLSPTPLNVQRWFNNRGNGNCRECNRERRPKLAHILNKCTPNYPLMTKRYHQLAEVAKTTVSGYLENDLCSMIQANK
jgi:hypothetical protein